MHVLDGRLIGRAPLCVRVRPRWLRLRDGLRAPKTGHIKCRVFRDHRNHLSYLFEHRERRNGRVQPETCTIPHEQWSKNKSTYLPVCHSWRSINLAIFLVDALAYCSAETLANEIEVRLLRRHIRGHRQVEANVTAVEAVLLA